ncbi:MAG: PadR family transcriptional regulator [Thermoprotei archaeon]
MPRGMKIGAVSLWLLLLLSERPMYGYEIIRELEKRFSGYWKPKTGTIYPALEKLEKEGLITSNIDFQGKAPDRKHYAPTEKGLEELSKTMAYWTKMMEILENYRETHEAIYRHKGAIKRKDLGELFSKIGSSLKSGSSMEIIPLLSQAPFTGSDSQKGKGIANVTIKPPDDLNLKFLYARENQKLEINMELQWVPEQKIEGNNAGRSRQKPLEYRADENEEASRLLP